MGRRALLLFFLIGTGCDRKAESPLPSPSPTVSVAPVASAAGPTGSPSSSPIAAAVASQMKLDTTAFVEDVKQKCEAGTGVTIGSAPLAPHVGAALRILGTSPAVPKGLVIVPPNGERVLSWEVRLGPPAAAYGEIPTPEEGTYRVALFDDTKVLGCASISVAAKAAHPPRQAEGSGGWAMKHNWTAADEDLYSAWVEKLFDAPIDQQPSFHSLDEITSDPKKNFLHDYLGLAEDEPPPKGLRLHPDCADLPFTLRAYFAWKMKLPVGFSQCTRGGGGRAPTCPHHFTSMDPMEDGPHENVRRFEEFVRKNIGDTVHSGTGRTRGDDDATDYYPIKLAPGTLRPGVVYADPYGHTLVVAKIIPQTDTSSGVLLAVDGQPDGTVGRKRFWEGNFLFSLDDPASGGPGFKRFRKLDAAHGLRLIPNRDLGNDPAYADFGLDQYAGGATEFYDKVDDVLNPTPRDPERALLDTIQALEEQAKTRVISVGNGEDRFKKSQGVIPMPDGTKLFETEGEWEDFSTPSRDMRMLIAIDVATGFPARVARRPDRFKIPNGKSIADVEANLKTILDKELHARTLTYTRMDGSSFTLSLADLLDRQKALEMAYNPNDCVESRWGAPEGSDEAKTCKRHAPADQRAKMEQARSWFATRKRPARK